MLKISKVICTTIAATAIFSGTAVTTALRSNNKNITPFVSITANAGTDHTPIEGTCIRVNGWEPIRKKKDKTSAIVWSVRDQCVNVDIVSGDYMYVNYCGHYGWICWNLRTDRS